MSYWKQVDLVSYYHGWDLLVESQQLKHQDNIWNLFRFNNKDTRTTSMTSFWCLDCWFGTYIAHIAGVFIGYFEQVNNGWLIISSEFSVTFSTELPRSLRQKLRRCFSWSGYYGMFFGSGDGSVFRSLSSIWGGDFFKNSSRLKSVNYFLMKLYFRCLTWFWVCHCIL